MKKIASTEFKVGITIITATLILIFGIIWGKGFRLQTNKYQLNLLFENVGGLIPGDPVTVNGVKEGKVLEIGWKERLVLCTIELNDKVKLYEDASFMITSAELLAGMKIEIFPGTSKNHINLSQQPFKGKYGGRIVDVGLIMGDLANDIRALSYRIDTTVIKVNAMISEGSIQKNIIASLENLNKASHSFTKLPDNISRTLGHLDSTILLLNKVVRNNEQQLHSTLRNVDIISSQLDTVSASLKVVMDKIENRRGTLGKLVNDTTLYNDMSRTLLRVDSLTKQIKEKGLDLNLF